MQSYKNYQNSIEMIFLSSKLKVKHFWNR